MSLLDINGISAGYGHVKALKKVFYNVEEGEIVSVIGSNGAGKTTFLKVISGLVRPTEGAIFYKNEKLPQKAHQIVAAGIVHVPEGRKTFSGLSVEENLLVGAYLCLDSKEVHKRLSIQYDLFPVLKERSKQFAGTLSGGEQQMLAIARGLMAAPHLLLLDEPSLGLAPFIIDQVFELIVKIKQMGITILLVEQNARKALSICDKACVIENGTINICGTGKELLNSDEVKKAYLGA
ncbi:MAG: ABC transporter ATP-binding protein [Anaerolineaceae bacterium]|nr:ABC transporter ATP-binding protein [Anaerolineaceae bacterium]